MADAASQANGGSSRPPNTFRWRTSAAGRRQSPPHQTPPRRFLPLPVETFAQTPLVLEGAAALSPSPAGEGWSLPRTGSGGDGSSGRRPPHQQPRADSNVYRPRRSSPLQGERQIPPSSAEIGEGSSGEVPLHDTVGASTKPTSKAPRLIPLLRERVGACPGLDPGVRGLPVEGLLHDSVASAANPPASPALNPSPGGEGWGEGSSDRGPLHDSVASAANSPARPREHTRVGVRGLPGNHPWGYANIYCGRRSA